MNTLDREKHQWRNERKFFLFPFILPSGAEQSSHDDELAKVVHVVVGHQESLAEDCLSLAMGDGFEQVGPPDWQPARAVRDRE